MPESPLIEKISRLRQERHAVILAHNYQQAEIQDIADFVGDSLELSIKAAATDAEVIVFCGVRFMAETAKILSPGKTVLLPRPDAGCPMADMADAAGVRRMKAEHPDAIAICYVNSSIEVKAECEITCTSANAAAIVRSIPPEREIIFLPDRNLGANVEKQCGRSMLLWPGFCPTHARLIPEIVREAKARYPDAPVMVHPECEVEVTALADAVLSTGGMVKYARENPARRFVVGTEIGMLHRLRQENPAKEFIALWDRAVCPNMKLTTLPDVLAALEKMSPEIVIEEALRRRAELPLRRMLQGKW